MLEAARELNSIDKVDAADIAAIPLYAKAYHLNMVSLFEAQNAELQRRKKIKYEKLVEFTTTKGAKGDDALNAVRSLFISGGG